MKLTVVPHYMKRDANGQTYRLQRQDVVDLNSFFRACCITMVPVGFPGEDRPAERMVQLEFSKSSGFQNYVMPVTEYKRLMRTDLVPGLC